MEANRIVVSEFGTMAYPDSCKNIFSKAFTYLSHVVPEFTDNCLINIIKLGDHFYASTETNFIRKIDPQSLETLEKNAGVNLVRIPMTTAKARKDDNGDIYCQPETMCEGIELPRINYDYNGKKYRYVHVYVYATYVEWRPIPTKIVKFDIVTKHMLSWTEEMSSPAEPMFIPHPEAKEEDEGVILSSVVSSDPY